jgi:alkylation response protein AidB-like acyl-CoA dehydrogenase
MEGAAMSELDQFRSEARSWLEKNCPPEMLKPLPSTDDVVWGGRKSVFPHPDAKLWLERMGEKGWTVPTWPKEYGGGGLSGEEARVLKQEMRSLGCRGALFSFGISMLGPCLLEYGTEEQKKEHLPKIARGEIRWCQGYSEPGAGSDLASLQCRAVREGDEYVVTGQKIWTSEAHLSDWIFCLVRTDPEASKHEGISFLLIDMDEPGCTTTPIELISGASMFCQTFLDGARVPVKNLVGTENAGWTIAKRLLQHERSMLSEGGGGPPNMGKRKSNADRAREALECGPGPLPDADLRDRITRLEMDNLCYKATLRRSSENARAGRGPGPETSMFKLYVSELSKRKADLRVRIAGAGGLGWEGEGFDDQELASTREWLRAKSESIAGGTSEIQLNIIAKRVLGLPD